MDVTQLTNQSLIDTFRAYPDRHPDRGPVIMEMRKRGMLGEDSRLSSLHKAVAEGGNVNALRDFYNSGAGGKIDWGKAGDFASCVKIASRFMTSDKAKGFCAERHRDATGGPPGSEDVKKENPNHVDSGPGGGQFTSSGGGGSNSDSPSTTSSAVIAPPNAYSPTSPLPDTIVNYNISPKKVKATSANSAIPKSEIPPTPKAPGQVAIHGLKSPTVHIAKPKTVSPIKPKQGEVKEPKPKPGASGGSAKISFK